MTPDSGDISEVLSDEAKQSGPQPHEGPLLSHTSPPLSLTCLTRTVQQQDKALTYARLRFCPPGAQVARVMTPTTRVTVKNCLFGTLETVSGKHRMFQKNKRPVWEGQERRDVSRDPGGHTGWGQGRKSITMFSLEGIWM